MKTLWIVEWRECPPYKGYEYELYTTKKEALRAMNTDDLLWFKGESLRLWRADLMETAHVRVQQEGEEPS